MTHEMTLKALHDRLLAEKPAGAVHDAETCPLCAMTDDKGTTDDPKGGSMSDKTYTEAEFKAELDKATAPLAARVAELETSQQVSEVESQIAAVRAEADAEIAELTKQLDEATVTAQTEKERADSFVAWLDGEQVAQEAAALVAARKDERLTKVKAAANFSDEYLAKHADRFAAMTDDDFAAHIEGLAEIASANGITTSTRTIPSTTGLHAARDETTRPNGSATKEIFALRRAGRVDLSTL